jgi:serpin B
MNQVAQVVAHRRGSRALLMVAGVGWLIACGEQSPAGQAGSGPQPQEVVYGALKERDRIGSSSGADFTAVVAAQNAFALELFRVLRESNPSANSGLGGYSVHQVLGMLYAGASGVTAAQMQEVLGWDLPMERFHSAMNALDLELLSRGDEVTLAIANRVWAQRGLPLEPDFLDVLTGDYGAPLAVADFATDAEAGRESINDWVSLVTHQKIPELFGPGTIASNTQLVLANAMYLDAPWKYKFDPARTREAAFTLLDGTTVSVETMHFDDFLPSAGGEGWQAVELPYRGDELSMVVIVPDDLPAFEAGLTAEGLGELLEAIKPGGIHLSLPKLEFSFHVSMVDAFKSLGLTTLFDGADFSNITGGAGLSVAEVEHEVYFQVDEAGTRAAAATGASLADSHGPTVSVDRPFMFVIRDRSTGAILFLGRVLDPRPKL